jgi:HSP20 family molecular chaperone IbpA
MAVLTRRREAATSRPLAVWEETGGAWIVEAELPGVRREDVTVELVDAEFRVLTVRIPKPEQPRPRRVAVQAREA